MALPFEILTTEDRYTGTFSLLLFGTMKHGKTYSMLSFPKPFVIYVDQNMSTLCNTPGVQYVVYKGWSDLTSRILPAIKNGLIDADTICLDTISSLGQIHANELANQGLDGFELFRTLAQDLNEVLQTLTDVTKPTAKRQYNIVVNCHMREDREKVVDQKGKEVDTKLVGYIPDIDGATRRQLCKKFDTVLLLTSPMEPVNGENRRRYYAHVDPPSKLYANLEMTLGDGYGGNKNNKRLPTKFDLTNKSLYNELRCYWGIDQEPKK
jgi:hypothetical protein